MKLHLPKALAAAVMALFAVPNALAETVTITMGGNQYEGTTVLSTEVETAPSEGEYVFFNRGLNQDYTVSSSTNWVCSTAKTLIMGNATYVDPSTSETVTCPTSRLYVNAASGTLTVGANLILGSAEGENADALRLKGNGANSAVINGPISVVNYGARIWNEAGTNYMQGAILAEGKTIKVVGGTTSAVLRLAGGGTIGTLNLAQAGGSVTLSATNQAGTAANGLEYTITTMASVDSTAALTVESGVTLNLTNYKSGTLTNTGTVKFAASSSLGSVLSVGGTLDLSAVQTISVDSSDAYKFLSVSTNNGYLSDITLISYTGTNTVSVQDTLAGGGWLENATLSYNEGDKKLLADISSYGIYGVGTDTATKDDTTLTSDQTKLIAVGSGVTLGLDEWEDSKSIASLGGIINIAKGSFLSSSSLQATAATTIKGAGSYTTNSITSYGANVDLSATEWLGNLVISGAEIKGQSIDTFAKNSSLVTLQGVTGHLASAATVTKNLELSKSGTLNGLKINDGYTSNADAARLQFTLSGAISGNGDLEISKESASFKSPMAYALTGDLSAWTGNFVTSATYGDTTTGTWRTKELRLSGNSGAPEGSDYHAVISNGIKVTGNGILNVIVSNANAVLLSGDITAGNGTLNLTVDGTGSKTLSGSVSVNKVTVAADSGGLKYTGSGMSLTRLEGTLTIGSTGVVNGPSSAVLGLGTGSNSGKILIDMGGSFSSDGMKYMANGQQATIAGGGQDSLELRNGSVSISNALIEKTTAIDKNIAIALTNVALKVSNGTTTLKDSKQQTLSKITVGSGATVKMENTHTDSSITLVEGGGRFETTRNFTGTLAGGANATLTAKLADTAQTGTVVKVDASVGSVDLLNTSSVTVTDMVIGAGKTVGVYRDSAVTNPSSSDEGSVTLTKLKVDGAGATLNANLELSTGGTLTLNGTLTMGSTLTLNSGITLSGSLLQNWTERSNALTLFSGVDGLTVNGVSVAAGETNGVKASDVFGDSWSNYSLVMTGGTNSKNYNVLLVQTSDTPEPTTATLSLLALMGLAARRRRKAAK